jgi:predicted aldo/keto reductase-like oxidoreductase
MGVFIISPTDKGGMLYRPTRALAAATAPLR